MRTQVGIVGAGPAGLFLSLLLQRAGVDCMVLESRSRDYVESRVRAGVLEQGTVNLMEELGAADRLARDSFGIEAVHRNELFQSRARLLAGEPALTDPVATLRTMRRRRGPVRLVRPPHLGRAASAALRQGRRRIAGRPHFAKRRDA